MVMTRFFLRQRLDDMPPAIAAGAEAMNQNDRVARAGTLESQLKFRRFVRIAVLRPAGDIFIHDGAAAEGYNRQQQREF